MPRRVKVLTTEEMNLLTPEELSELRANAEATHKAREERRISAEKEANNLWIEKFTSLKRADLDLFLPNHSRTSCSDMNIVNGFGTQEDDLPRCTRCGFLELLGGMVFTPPKNKLLHIDVYFSLKDV